MFPGFIDLDLRYLLNYKLVDDYQDVPEVIDAVSRVDLFSYDIETTGFHHLRNSMHGISLATADREWYVTGPALLAFLDKGKFLFNEGTRMAVAHNQKFDLKFLSNYDILPPVGSTADTMLMQALLDENQTLALKTLINTQLGIKDKFPSFGDLQMKYKKILGYKRKDQVDIHLIPIEELGPYAARDTRFTYMLYEHSLKQLKGYPAVLPGYRTLEDIFWNTEMPYSYVLLDMERAGLVVDENMLVELEKDFTSMLDQITSEWNQLTNNTNPNSTPALRKLLFDELKLEPTEYTTSENPVPKVDELNLKRLRGFVKDGSKEARILDGLGNFRKYSKLLNTYVTTWREEMFDGKLYSSFNQTGTVTWRLSSSNPINFQNFPARGVGAKVRYVFIGGEGYVISDYDYSQLELRGAAHFSKDPTLMHVFQNELDPHQMTADQVGVARHIGKTLNFLRLYGGKARKLADTIEKNGYPRPAYGDAVQWLESFSGAYPNLDKWTDAVIRFCKKHEYVVLLDGRLRRLPEINGPIPELRAKAERQSSNAVIQGMAGILIKDAQLEVFKFQKDYDARQIVQVHDEVVCRVAKEAVEEFNQRKKDAMEAVGEKYGIRVPLVVEGKYADSWGEAK